MKYWSDELNRTFATVEELEEAEAEHSAKLAEAQKKREQERERREALAAEKKERFAEVRRAYLAADKLKEKYIADYYQEQCGLDGLLHFLMDI